MKTILCYGDSNTWGACPETHERFSRDRRWPGILSSQLGEKFHIIEEGLCGRSINLDSPDDTICRNGLSTLPLILETHSPLDLLLILLGTNDLNACYRRSLEQIGEALASLLDCAQSFLPAPKNILVISPAHVVSTQNLDHSKDFFEAIEKSKQLALIFEKIARKKSCYFFDAASVVESSVIDGIHLDAGAHTRLGEALEKQIFRII